MTEFTETLTESDMYIAQHSLVVRSYYRFCFVSLPFNYDFVLYICNSKHSYHKEIYAFLNGSNWNPGKLSQQRGQGLNKYGD